MLAETWNIMGPLWYQKENIWTENIFMNKLFIKTKNLLSKNFLKIRLYVVLKIHSWNFTSDTDLMLYIIFILFNKILSQKYRKNVDNHHFTFIHVSSKSVIFWKMANFDKKLWGTCFVIRTAISLYTAIARCVSPLSTWLSWKITNIFTDRRYNKCLYLWHFWP